MSWLAVPENGIRATGRVCSRIPDLTTTAMLFAVNSLAALPSIARGVILSAVPSKTLLYMYFGVTPGTVPFSQFSGLRLDGVPPPIQVPRSRRGSRTHPFGTEVRLPLSLIRPDAR